MARTPVTASWRSAVLFVALLPALLAAAGRAEDSPLLAELVALTERIEEAVRTGDRATLERLSLPEMRLVNRDGKSYSQRELLDDIVPLRPGYDLRFTVLAPELLHQGDAALLSFLLDEYLTIWGVEVSTVYRSDGHHFGPIGVSSAKAGLIMKHNPQTTPSRLIVRKIEPQTAFSFFMNSSLLNH